MSRELYAAVIGTVAGMEAVAGTVSVFASLVRMFPSLSQFLQSEFSHEFEPDLVLVCQHWSDEYTQAEILGMISRFPLARIVCCYGPWCDSDGRTRDYWPAAVRVPLDQGARRIRQEVEVIHGIRDPLPLTAGLDELFRFDQH